MPATEHVIVYGRGEVAHGLAVVLREWGRARVSEHSDATHVGNDTSVLWIAFDTPVDAVGNANVDWIRERADEAIERLLPGALVIITSPVPVGFARATQERWIAPEVVSIPELVRRGRAEHGFRDPSVIVIGSSPRLDRERVRRLYDPTLHARMLWMSFESAEMTKHATNAFLATEVVFANEAAAACAGVGANYADVEQALRCDPRIGPYGYLKPGHADGSHLLRDVRYLTNINPNLRLLSEVPRALAWET